MLHQHSTAVAYGRKPPVLLKLMAQLGGFLPARDGSDAMRTGLIRAGYRRGDAVLVFLGTKVLLAAALPVVWSIAAYAMARPFGNIVIMSFVLALLGFYLPTFWIGIRARQRKGEIV